MRNETDCNPVRTSRRGLDVFSASMLAVWMCSCAQHYAAAQRISASVSSRVTDAAPSASIGTIARGPGGEHAGVGSYSIDQSTSRIASGKMQGYGAKLNQAGMGESAAPGGAASFSTNRDFPENDFVATMPRPNYSAASPAASGLGLHLSGGAVSGSHAFSSSGTHAASTSVPTSHLKTAESILNPFTPSIGGSLGGLPSTTVGRLP